MHIRWSSPYCTPQARPYLFARRGFSLLELTIVLSIALIAAGILIPNMTTAVRLVRLNGASTSYANLLQQARIRAVRDDRYYSVVATPAQNGAPARAFVDIAGTGIYAAGDPVVDFPQGVVPMSFASGPNLSNLKAQFLPPGAIAQNSVNTNAAGPTFGPRGMPCSPLTASGYTTCPSLTPTSFITFLQNSQGGAWQAVTVTPAGRVRAFSYQNPDWTPLN